MSGTGDGSSFQIVEQGTVPRFRLNKKTGIPTGVPVFDCILS